MPRHPTIAYQPALDGVRALAVAAVLLFHAEVPGVSGGYLGVSVFFTLSGFLITSLLVAEVETNGRVAAGAFYARRARRLLPASVLCVGVIVALAATTAVFDGVTDLRRHVVGSLLQVANWVFLVGDGSYQDLFERSAGAVSPLEHYWSLAIEEQFYWLWPVAFTGLVAVARSRRARVAVLGGVTVVAAVAAPLIAAVWGGDAAYWATPARAAEILVGALLAVALAGRTLDRRVAWLAPPALGALVLMCATFPAAGGPAYNGALPLVAVASGALLLALQAAGPVRTALSAAPLVWLGRISYGVYLYHWPVYVLLDERRTGLDDAALLAVRLVVTLAVAEASFLLVEQPIRHASGVGGRRTAAFAGASTAALVVAAVAVIPTSTASYWTTPGDVVAAAAIRPTEEPLTPLAPTSSVTPAVPATAVPSTVPEPSSSTGAVSVPATTNTTPTTVDTTTVESTTVATTTTAPVPVPSRPVRIVVAGDSTAAATGAGLVAWAAANPALAQVELAAEPGCGFVRGGELMIEQWTAIDPRCDRWLDQELPATVERLAADAVVLMTTSWDVLDRRWDGGAPLTPLDPSYAKRVRTDVAAVTARLLDAGVARVVWVREPIPNVFWWGSGQPQEDPARHDVVYTAMEAAGATDDRVVVVDLPAWLSQQGLETDQDARPDGVHWSAEASARIAEEFLGEQVLRAVLVAAP